MKKARILGLAASLRNARRGLGNVNLIESLQKIDTQTDLFAFLKQEASLHLENFQNAGRQAQSPFDELYKNLKKQKGDKGLSNSEIALAAALWSAHKIGCEIDHLSLSEHFTEE